MTIADRSMGCVRCGKACALVGDIVPDDELCPWCREASAPAAYRAYRNDCAQHVDAIVNGRRVRLRAGAFTYEHVVQLTGIHEPTVTYETKYPDAPGTICGTLAPGQRLQLQPGMRRCIINAANTSAA